LIKILGKGSYGKVYQALNSETGKLVAIKLVKNIYKNRNITQAILREITIMR